MVHCAGIQDRIGAKQVLTKLVSVSLSRAEAHIWADGGYAGKLVEWVAAILQLTLPIVKRPRTIQRHCKT